MVWTFTDFSVEVTPLVSILAAVVTFLAGACMVLNINYYSFKDLDFRNRVPFIVILGVVMTLVIVSWNPPSILFTLAIAYALSGPAMAVIKKYGSMMSFKKVQEGQEEKETVAANESLSGEYREVDSEQARDEDRDEARNEDNEENEKVTRM
jgi:CDP-diacylglycerol--serine O-phosphatidyltransferase